MNERWIGGGGCGREEPDLEVLSESALARAQSTMQNAIDQAGIKRAALARTMDVPRSFVTRMLSGSHNLTITTMARCLGACGYEIDFGIAPITWNWCAVEPEIVECKVVPSVEGTPVLMTHASLAEGCLPRPMTQGLN